MPVMTITSRTMFWRGAMDVLAGYPIFALSYSATGCRHLTITIAANFAVSAKGDGLMDIYAINDPFIPTFKKALQLRGIIQSDRCTPPFSSLATCQTESILRILSRAVLKFNA